MAQRRRSEAEELEGEMKREVEKLMERRKRNDEERRARFEEEGAERVKRVEDQERGWERVDMKRGVAEEGQGGVEEVGG